MDTENVKYIAELVKKDIFSNYETHRSSSEALMQGPMFARLRERKFPDHTDEDLRAILQESGKRLHNSLDALMDLASTYKDAKIKTKMFEGIKEEVFGWLIELQEDYDRNFNQ